MTSTGTPFRRRWPLTKPDSSATRVDPAKIDACLNLLEYEAGKARAPGRRPKRDTLVMSKRREAMEALSEGKGMSYKDAKRAYHQALKRELKVVDGPLDTKAKIAKAWALSAETNAALKKVLDAAKREGMKGY